MNTKTDKIKFAIGLMLSAMPCFQVGSSTSHFAALYKDFEIPVSAFTSFLMAAYPVFYVLPILVLAAWFMPRWQIHRGMAALAVGISVFLLGFLYGVALWWPIMSAEPALP